ncbi:hypothetical protein EMIHUDRAFT_439996, partial [Emiliania huxleyi CCMP1516]|uniref:Uncharacterized protein n=2 Tax=Emiliania huxleyi TaxID=2903 RepID=A0A0D3KSK8_EMIH1
MTAAPASRALGSAAALRCGALHFSRAAASRLPAGAREVARGALRADGGRADAQPQRRHRPRPLVVLALARAVLPGGRGVAAKDAARDDAQGGEGGAGAVARGRCGGSEQRFERRGGRGRPTASSRRTRGGAGEIEMRICFGCEGRWLRGVRVCGAGVAAGLRHVYSFCSRPARLGGRCSVCQ